MRKADKGKNYEGGKKNEEKEVPVDLRRGNRKQYV